MKELDETELDKAAQILQTLDHDSLAIIQHLASLGPYGVDSEISITTAKFLNFNYTDVVKINIDALEQVGIVRTIDAASFNNPDARLIQLKQFSDMPALAQAILLALWPDWFGKNVRRRETKPA